jgi:hypothetical protein
LGDLSFVASAAAWTLTAQTAAPRFFNPMPQRFLRPTIRQSKRWNRLPWEAQSLFIRLLTLVDDFGRYEADPELLKSEAFPFGDPCGQMITVENICLQLQALVSKNMIVLYEVNDASYLQLTRWNERARAEKSRFPPPPEHLLSDVSKCLLPSPSSPPSPSPSPPPATGERQLPTIEMARTWLKLWQELGADYSDSEFQTAFLALSASGWMWGRNPVVDFRAALERQIQTDRQRAKPPAKPNPLATNCLD